MPSKSEQATRRTFEPMQAAGLSDEARKAVNAVFDAMSNWRAELANRSEKNLEQVIEKMADAARTLGWPAQIVEASHMHLQNLTKTQIQVVDQLMDAWEEQIKSPNPMAASSALLSKLKSLPGLPPTGTWTDANAFGTAAMNPMQFWMQSAEHMQKAWTQAMDFWANVGRQQRGH
jgi:hypothetical protein